MFFIQYVFSFLNHFSNDTQHAQVMASSRRMRSILECTVATLASDECAFAKAA
ncbi:hypothetical protein [Nonlabens tegetincola]|uniref:hypothetical protein n=1 Tax=Nonlabens tegetincola TaxID=323273 RepID=UPI0015E2DDFA|nr:hypothetical protein [Nonlabens tegetincola]